MSKIEDKGFCVASSTFKITYLEPSGKGRGFTDDGLRDFNNNPVDDYMIATRTVKCVRAGCQVRRGFVVSGYGNEPYHESGQLAVAHLRRSCPLWKEMIKMRWKSHKITSKLNPRMFFPK